MTQPKALFLADVIESDPTSAAHHDEAAAELRRLHAQRDALLEALRAAVADWDAEVGWGRWLNAARAAIKAVEEA